MSCKYCNFIVLKLPNRMRYICLLIISLFFLEAKAQKSSEPFSCYQMKKHQHKDLKSLVDSRSDSIDIEHVLLEIDITNWSARTIYAKATISFEAKVNNINELALDLLKLQVDSVKMGATTLSYAYNDTLLNIDLSANLNAGQNSEVSVYYSGTPIQNSADWGGFYWNNTYAYNVGVSFLEDPHNYGRAWFPCFDNFVERSTYEFKIRTNDTRKAFCNGLLQSEVDNLDGSITWHWEMNQEIPSYLANMAVADYATVYMTYNGIQSAPIPIELAARATDTIALKGSFVNLINALQCYEEFYAPYAFDRVGYCLTTFNAGAMEHATNITYSRNAVNGGTAYETLMAHELAHHWWGDLITCQTAEDMWLNEGWASFSEALFTEYVYGKDAYKEYSRENHDEVLRLTHINDGGYHPVSGVPTELTYSSTVYDKGAEMAHTIRGIIGDDDFMDCIQGFLNDHAFSDVNSADFEAYLSTCSGKDLSSFFDTWIYEGGFHHYSVKDLNTIVENGNVRVEGTVRQKLWENQNYTQFLPIDITFFDENGNQTTFVVNTYGECSSFSFDLNFVPVYYALDLEEKIQDATVDKYEYIGDLGTTDFDLARVIFDVQEINDTAFVHATHHYIQPDAFIDPIPGLHLSPNRYWSVGGVWDAIFRTNAIFRFDGTTSQNSGYLDNDFITNSEDSLVLLYKAKPNDDWSIVDSFTLNPQGSVNNKVGYFEVYDVKAGDYVMAIYDASKPDNNASYKSCLYTSIYDLERLDKLVKIYPVPAKDYFKIDFLDSNLDHLVLKVTNIIGKEVYNLRIKPSDDSLEIATANWQKGAYIVSLHAGAKLVYSNKIVVE